MKREFLMLAKTLKDSDRIGGWMFSEKLDGMRCFWDGGITRGLLCTQVPWANTLKDARYTGTRLATGLWTRYGKPIYAPDSFLDSLPKITLDGELYAGRGNFQQVTATCKDLVPGAGWGKIRYAVFDSPSIATVFADGLLDSTNFKKKFADVVTWAKEKGGKSLGHLIPFKQAHDSLKSVYTSGTWYVHEQIELPMDNTVASNTARRLAAEISDQGGEGGMVRRAWGPWRPERSSDLLKIKPFDDSEGIVVGYTWGRKTDLGSKLLGLMGNMVVSWQGQRFELSGFTNEERRLEWEGSFETAYAMGCALPGEPCTAGISSPRFPLGSTVTFTYRELTDAGIPKEARFWRKHEA